MRVYLINLRAVKKHLASLIVLLFILSVLITGFNVTDYYVDTATKVELPIIIIDAGHGGEDSGAVGEGEIYEKDLNLAIAFELGKQLSEKGYTIVYTRANDKLLYTEEQNIKGMRKLYDLKNRCAVAEEYANAIFISIHMNSYGASKYSGLQVYYADKSEESKALATSIQKNVCEGLQKSNNRKIKNGKGFYILDNCSATSVIIECGFMYNKEELKKLSEKEYQKQLSFSIICGIIEYINTN